MLQSNQFQGLHSATVLDCDGQKLGSVGHVFLDDISKLPAYVTVQTGLIGTRETLVPVESAHLSGQELLVPYRRAFILGAPNVEANEHLDDALQEKLLAYYRRDRPAPQ